jgi:hypothetical protein
LITVHHASVKRSFAPQNRCHIPLVHSATLAAPTGQDAAHNWKTGDIAMKTVLSALVVLSVIAGVAGSASALDAKTFYEQVDRNHY